MKSYLRFEKFVEICFHETLHNVDVFHEFHALRSQDVSDVNDVLMVESGQDLDLPERSLTISLMFERRYLLNRNFGLSLVIKG